MLHPKIKSLLHRCRFTATATTATATTSLLHACSRPTAGIRVRVDSNVNNIGPTLSLQ